MASRDTGFHPADADWTRGRGLALSEAAAIVRKEEGLARKVTMKGSPDADA